MNKRFLSLGLIFSSICFSPCTFSGELPSTQGRIYRCLPDHYDYCVIVAVTSGTFIPNRRDPAETAAAWQAAMGGVATAVAKPNEPILQCGNSHGASACCHIIGTNPDDGSIYVECGNP